MRNMDQALFRRQLLWAACILFPLIAMLAAVDQLPFMSADFSRGQVFGRDNYIFWTAGRLLAEGRLDELYDVEAFQRAVRAELGPEAGLHLFAYPPPALPGLWLMGQVTYGVALAGWTAVCVVSFIAAVAAPLWRRETVLLTLIAVPTLMNVAIGQNGLFCAALFIAGLRLVSRHPILAGICIGMLIIKPIVALPLPFVLLARRQWRAILSAGMTVIALGLLPILLWGPEVWSNFLLKALPAQQRYLETGVGIAQAMKPTVFMSLRYMGVSVPAAYWVQVGASLFALSLLVLHLTSRGTARQVAPFDILVAATAGACAMPYLHVYDLATTSGALALVVAAGQPVPPAVTSYGVPALLWAVPLVALVLNLLLVPIAPLILFLSLAVLVFSPRSSPA